VFHLLVISQEPPHLPHEIRLLLSIVALAAVVARVFVSIATSKT
jgi:hypothetical protein